MEASIKYRFSVGLLVTVLAVVSTALTLHLHLKVEHRYTIDISFDILPLHTMYVSEISIKYFSTLFTTKTAYMEMCVLLYYEIL